MMLMFQGWGEADRAVVWGGDPGAGEVDTAASGPDPSNNQNGNIYHQETEL